MQSKGYTLVPDWMLDLGLDIYETLILAVIFGFSQDGESTFAGSWNYLENKAKCSRRKVANTLPKLVEMGLLEKIDKDIRGIKLCEYRVCTTCTGSAPRARGGAPDAPNNIVNNIDEDINISSVYNKAKRFVKPTLEEVSAYCSERQNDVNPQSFLDFYEAKGWKIGNTPMKDWKACVRTWEKGRRTTASSAPRTKASVYEQNARLAEMLQGKYNGDYGKRDYNPDEQ